jgi:penicillin amidase
MVWRAFMSVVVVPVAIVAGGTWWLSDINAYRQDGSAGLPGLYAPVTIDRDARGIPYIHADSVTDAVRAQGWVLAQDRLFQLEGYRRLIAGRLAEMIGERGLRNDITMRVLGVRRDAEAHARKLAPETRAYLQAFVGGINAYLEELSGELPVEFAIAGLRPEPWTVADIVAIVHYINHVNSGNMRAEILAQRLIDRLGPVKARTFLPLDVNPDVADRPGKDTGRRTALAANGARLGLGPGDLLVDLPDPTRRFGSDDWAVAPSRSASGAATVANDPHLDARLLPGIWYPVGLITPQVRAVGLAIPGLPGIFVGRTDRIAYGVTNAYGDVRDLFIETVDPDDPTHYLEGGKSLPFETRQEVIRIKDDDAPGGFRERRITVRSTRRGPVITDHGLGPRDDKVLSLRWTAATEHGPHLGIERLWQARSVDEALAALSDADLLLFNYVIADVDGHIARKATGKIPVRASGDGSVPQWVVDDSDAWTGWIPFDEMPGEKDPPGGVVASANQDTRPAGYPYYYASHFASSYRYRRVRDLLDGDAVLTVDDHWRFIRDTFNPQAARLLPVLLPYLAEAPETAPLAEVLDGWDYRDRADEAAPLAYQELYRQFARLTVEDEMGEKLAADLLDDWYFWQERLDAMAEDGRSPWFDDIATKRTEDLGAIAQRAGAAALARLRKTYGDDPAGWRWGDAHTIRFMSPLRRDGFGAELLAGGPHPQSGSGDTLLRGAYLFNQPYKIVYHDSARLVADLGDPDKITAVVPGGVSGRHLTDHQQDEVVPWLSGTPVHWWFSDAAIAANSEHRLVLTP